MNKPADDLNDKNLEAIFSLVENRLDQRSGLGAYTSAKGKQIKGFFADHQFKEGKTGGGGASRWMARYSQTANSNYIYNKVNKKLSSGSKYRRIPHYLKRIPLIGNLSKIETLYGSYGIDSLLEKLEKNFSEYCKYEGIKTDDMDSFENFISEGKAKSIYDELSRRFDKFEKNYGNDAGEILANDESYQQKTILVTNSKLSRLFGVDYQTGEFLKSVAKEIYKLEREIQDINSKNDVLVQGFLSRLHGDKSLEVESPVTSIPSESDASDIDSVSESNASYTDIEEESTPAKKSAIESVELEKKVVNAIESIELKKATLEGGDNSDEVEMKGDGKEPKFDYTQSNPKVHAAAGRIEVDEVLRALLEDLLELCKGVGSALIATSLKAEFDKRIDVLNNLKTEANEFTETLEGMRDKPNENDLNAVIRNSKLLTEKDGFIKELDDYMSKDPELFQAKLETLGSIAQKISEHEVDLGKDGIKVTERLDKFKFKKNAGVKIRENMQKLLKGHLTSDNFTEVRELVNAVEQDPARLLKVMRVANELKNELKGENTSASDLASKAGDELQDLVSNREIGAEMTYPSSAAKDSLNESITAKDISPVLDKNKEGPKAESSIKITATPTPTPN